MRSKYFILVGLLLLLAVPNGFVFAEESGKIKLIGLYDESLSSSSSKDPFSQQKFLPGISFILDFSYVRRNIDGEVFAALEIPGFIEGESHSHGEDGHSHASMNGENGFNLNYGELVLYAVVDPYFDLFTSFHLSESSFEIEEAYVTTRRLPLGFRAKLGKFYSSFGRLNEQHHHLWDFADAPLVYRAFFGDEGLLEKGIQLNWVAPTDFYLGFGIETLQGENENSFGTEGFDLMEMETEEEIEIEETPLPNTWTFFGKTSLDIGDLVVLAGISYALGKSRINRFEEEHESHGFAGDARIFGVNFTAKYIMDSYRYLVLQVEYMSRDMEGTRYTVHEDNHEHEGFEVESAPLEKKQAGLYAQLIFRLHKLWRLGARWDYLNKNHVILDGNPLGLSEKLNRYSFMVDYNPTEFSRIRLQYNINKYGYVEEARKNFHGFILQFNLAIGAHGAHPF
ncbi:MAG: hypothetical protein GTO45_04310 [Candidatus Aminicenantes bacterium]|nr:hypothetical protein [Candidatus Aminicenantes bacterium]NIM77963.1 hypothetical protein [Candidatus Aminicenantes bacterium]NIN17292.1 hypothetical protein [Candidatus Aminicenantes bacterium]NIN41183.1 hypothetical protein [Candidatus Aminicenantes bacterium]NIN83960.1 hypothetical protein [Candidatus Aminicenantes bacterium]